MAINRRKHVLDGYKALDFTQFVAGPTVTKLMAEMGAEVIKVELAPDGDRSRAMPFVKNERSGYFVQQNRGKLSLCLDRAQQRRQRPSFATDHESRCIGRKLRARRDRPDGL